jgi:DNA-binding CsgD family transcriptional regulator/tetratricopeptide (TPR) repeat protein
MGVMTSVRPLETYCEPRELLSTGFPSLTLVGQQAGTSRPAPRPPQNRPYEDGLAAIFANLFGTIDFGAGTAISAHPAADESRARVEEHSDVTFLLAAIMLGAGRMVQAAELLRRLDTMTGSRPDRRQWRARSEFLWAVYAERAADIPGVIEHSAAATRLMRAAAGYPSAALDTQGRRLLQTVDAVASEQLPVLAARATIGLGDPYEAQAILESRYGSPSAAEVRQPALMARVACAQGRLNDALRLARTALQAADGDNARAQAESLEARVVLSEVFFERNALDAANGELQAALRWCCLTEAAPWMWTVKANLARLLVAQQRATEALPFLQDLRHVRESGSLAQPIMRMLNRVEIQRRTQLGDHKEAVQFVREGRRADFDDETLAEVELCSGRPDRVIAQLGTGRAPNLGAHIRRLVLIGCAEEQQGRRDKATDSIRRAVEAAQPEQYIRPFVEHATQISPLLRSIRASSSNRYLSELTEEAERIASMTAPLRATTVLEPLTAREREVLQYLPSHRTIPQIAKLLFVSTNTAKCHQKSLYRKTGANSRDEAVSIARSHGLI